jgi:hypothetical protein
MPDLDVLRVILATMVGLGVTYFLVPDAGPARAAGDARAVAKRPRDLMAEHLMEAHRQPEADCPLCEFEVHGPVR